MSSFQRWEPTGKSCKMYRDGLNVYLRKRYNIKEDDSDEVMEAFIVDLVKQNPYELPAILCGHLNETSFAADVKEVTKSDYEVKN